MCKVPVFFAVWSIIYGVVGFLLQENEVIVHPAYWAFYGYTFGAIGMGIALTIARGE